MDKRVEVQHALFRKQLADEFNRNAAGAGEGLENGLQGLWADGDTLEECRETLRECLELWLMVGLRHGDDIPLVDGIDLNAMAETEAA